MTLAVAVIVAIAAVAAVLFGPPLLLESWLTAWLAWTGVSVGALGALAIGHLLSEDWLAPVREPLEAAARSLPLAAIAALPVLAGLGTLYPWAGVDPPAMPGPRNAWFEPTFFRLRAVGFLALWSVLGWALTAREHPHRRRAALVLALLVPSVTIAAQDWALSRDPGWWGSLQGFAVWVEGIMAALALAAGVSLARRWMPGSETGAGEALERALLALGLTALWLWFAQFIMVWMADLPEEAGWYLRRADAFWSLLKLGVAVPALLLALALAAPPRHRPWRMAAVCVLLLVSYLAHLWWVVRPDALVDPPAWLDATVLAALGLAWATWWRAEMRRISRADPSAAHGPHPATATAR